MSVSAETTDALFIRVVDMLGRTVLESHVEGRAGVDIAMPLRGLAAGAYVLQASSGTHFQSQRLTVVR